MILLRFGRYVNTKEDKIYEGEWANDCQNGYGVEIYQVDNVYRGEFKDGQKNGKG